MRIANMKLNRLVVLLSILVGCTRALCNNTELNEFNFITKEQPNTVIDIIEKCVQILGLTQNSLDRFTNLTDYFVIEDFTLDDVNTLNQPNLFAHHAGIKELRFIIYRGIEELVVHEYLFGGLQNLKVLVLVGLNLVTIPKQLFSNLFELRSISLLNNKLQSLDPNVFSTNPKLSYTNLGQNQFLQSGIPLDLTLLHHRASISLLESYVNDFKPLMPIFQNPNITTLNLDLCNITNIKISDFIQIPEKKIRIDVLLYRAEYTFNIVDLQESGIEYQTRHFEDIDKVLDDSKAYIVGTIGVDSAMCNDCLFMKEAFHAYLRGIVFHLYLTNSKVLFSFYLDCENMFSHYTTDFKTNCPDQCTCQYNPFLTKVWIDCNDRNLTTVPTIVYPSQFQNIISISIDLSKNRLESFVSDNIDSGVLQHLAELYLNENQLKALNVEETTKLQLHRINLCNNPIWSETFVGVSILIDRRLENITRKRCLVGDEFPSEFYSMSLKTEKELHFIMENELCH